MKNGKAWADVCRRHATAVLAIALLWLKTYLVQRFVFDLPVEGWYQEWILLLTPVSSSLFMFGVGLAMAGKRQRLVIWLISFLTSFVLFANMVYYRFFNDFITLPVLMQSRNMGDLGSSILDLLRPYDPLVFADAVLLGWLLFRKKVPVAAIGRAQLASLCIAAIAVFFVNWSMAETVRPELLTRTFDRQIMVKSIGTFNYHLYDLILNSRMTTKKAFASSEDLMNAAAYLESRPKDEPDPELFGIAKNRNVFLISMESLQSFVINERLYGQEITPFLNELIKDSFYFDQFYHQTGQGKTSDAEFLTENSLYPLPSGAVFFSHANNVYRAVPTILKEQGYYTSVFHANDKTFWNRDLVYQNYGVNRFFHVGDYTVTEDNSIGWGLKDIDFFIQSVDMMRSLPQPFYAKLITLTNHHPFTLDEEDRFIPQYDSNSGTLNRYFPTVRYMDEALRVFFEKVKEAGLYDNSIFVLYGDHYGISSNHDKAMAKFLGKEEITPFDRVQLQRVPLIIHIPGVEGRTMSVVSGQIDVKPTLLHLLGIESTHGLQFGHDLFAQNKEDFVVLRDGSFVTKDYVYTGDTCYSKVTGQPVEDAAVCEPFREKAAKDLQYSDEIIYGDLLRFMINRGGEGQTKK